METTKNEMPPYAKYFFNKLSIYLDNKMYYFGSIQRNDYFPKSSDIDVDLFTDNETSTIIKLQNFLGIKRDEFKKFVYKLHKSNKLVHGYKVKYKDEINKFSTEISIYNEKNKEDVLLEHNSKVHLPCYISVMLIVLKYFYYDLQFLSKDVYKSLKKFVIDNLVEGRPSEFVTTEISNNKEDETD
jgi:predicted nucleotidyltransferase